MGIMKKNFFCVTKRLHAQENKIGGIWCGGMGSFNVVMTGCS